MPKNGLSYIAGFFDGEGTVFIAKKKSTARGAISNSHYIQVSIANTNKEVLIWINMFMGLGKVLSVRKQGIKPLYNLRIYSREAIAFLKAIYPYLKVKKTQATLAIEFQKTIKNLNAVESREKEEEIRDYYKLKIAKLNKFGGLYA